MSLLRKSRVALGRVAGAMKHPRQEPTQNAEQAKQKLRQAAADIEPVSTEGLAPAAAAWARNSNEFLRLCREGDPADCLQWRVVRKTMFVDASRYLETEYDYLRSLPDYEQRWVPAITESWVGRPPRYFQDGRTSGNRLHLAYHLARFREATGLDPSQFDSVLEFGGGYGCMCDTLHRLGFAGRYVVADLPVQSALQRYYLERNGRTLVEPDHAGPGVVCTDSTDRMREAASSLTGRRLFIATWSLSETPIELRESIRDVIEPFEALLIGYQQQFEQVDNTAFFERWPGRNESRRVTVEPIEHVPGSSYLFAQPV